MRIGITVGDAAGIGPEIVLKSLSAFPAEELLLIGPAGIIRKAARAFEIALDNTELLDTGALHDEFLHCGRDTAETGRASHEAVVLAARMALEKKLDAIVTAPISKEAWHKAGFTDPGHTELIGSLSGAKPVMAFIGRETGSPGTVLRLALATIHIPLAEVPRALSIEGLTKIFAITARDLRDRFHIPRPRLGVAGLNPHAGESGRFGSEEAETILPAIEASRRAGIAIEGPFPGDAIFSPRMRARFDLIVALYHDQGLAPFKALTSGTGVNVTLGLPIIRTSPDHGTAYDIAGKGVADPSSMIEAIRLARSLATPGI
ncbi:MAG: 4-hydroxythreonine-4-phosphate dehydrogenase PdxA [Candidatus Hydrogenedentota bacterium]